MVAVDGVAHRVDPGAVLGPEEARPHAEGVGEVARLTGKRVQGVDGIPQLAGVDGVGVGRDVRLREHLGVASGVDCGDHGAGALERLRDACGAGEQVQRGAGRRRLTEARQHRYQPALRAQVLDHSGSGAVEGGRAARRRTRAPPSGPPPFSSRAMSALPMITPSPNCAASHRLLRVGDPDAEEHRLVGDRLEAPTHLTRLARERTALAGDTHERHAVHEAAGALADGDEAIVGRGRRGQEHGLDVVRVGGVRPPAELVERKIGEDGGGDAGVAQCSREPPVAHVAHRVGVGHHHERHVDLELPRRR